MPGRSTLYVSFQKTRSSTSRGIHVKMLPGAGNSGCGIIVYESLCKGRCLKSAIDGGINGPVSNRSIIAGWAHIID